MAKLEKILEACNAFSLKTNISILEESAAGNVTELDLAKSKLVIHENIKYIKDQLTTQGILESAQNLLAANWTQAILEDMSLADIVGQDEGLSTGEMAGAGLAGAGAAAAGLRYQGNKLVTPLMAGAAAAERIGANRVADGLKNTAMKADNLGKASVTGDINDMRNRAGNLATDAARAMNNQALKTSIQTRSAVNDTINGVKDVAGRAQEAYTRGTNGLPQQGTYTMANKLGQVTRATKSMFK